MPVVYDLVVVLHLLGMAALVGGYLVVARGRAAPNAVMLAGARTQILTGIVIVGLGEAADVWGDDPPSYLKIGIKLVVALVVVALVEAASGRRKRDDTADVVTMTHVAGVLAVVNVLVAALVR